ncbi:glycosyltransferase family 4 protein [Nocardioides sp. W3-2-3]|nr:glycosyltransferase family 4 protein [Nocardioides convexus]
MVWPRREHAATDLEQAGFSGVHVLPSSLPRAVRALRGTVEPRAADVVHAHSSYAGMLVRSAGLDTRVAYSPHCFGFERLDLSTTGRAGVRRIERALVRRTDVLVACSPHEARLAEDLGHRSVVLVPNRALHPPTATAQPGEPLRAVAVGRIGAQKDWRFLLEVKASYERRYDVPVTWHWLGNGDAEGRTALRAAGVEVSGWLPRPQVLEQAGHGSGLPPHRRLGGRAGEHPGGRRGRPAGARARHRDPREPGGARPRRHPHGPGRRPRRAARPGRVGHRARRLPAVLGRLHGRRPACRPRGGVRPLPGRIDQELGIPMSSLASPTEESGSASFAVRGGFRALGALLWRRRWVVLLVLALVANVVAAGLVLVDRQYTASARVAATPKAEPGDLAGEPTPTCSGPSPTWPSRARCSTTSPARWAAPRTGCARR